MRMRNDGFTLVELMVVVLIIGILVAIAVPVFNAAKADAEKRTCYANQRMIDAAVEMWVAAEPGRRQHDLAVYRDGLPMNDAPGTPALIPTYLKSMPRCPSITDNTQHFYWWGSRGNQCFVHMMDEERIPVRGCMVHGAHWLQ